MFNRFVKRCAEVFASNAGRRPPTVYLHDAADHVTRLEQVRQDAPAAAFRVCLDIELSFSIQEAVPPRVSDVYNADCAVHLWITDELTLSKVKLPPEIRARRTTRIDKFVEAHETQCLGGREAFVREQIDWLQQELARTATHRVASRPGRMR